MVTVTVTVEVAPLLALGTEELIAVGLVERMKHTATGEPVAEDTVGWIHGIELLYKVITREHLLLVIDVQRHDHSLNFLVNLTVKCERCNGRQALRAPKCSAHQEVEQTINVNA